MKKLYDKSKIWFSVVWIIAYCVLMSVGDALSAIVGIEKSISLVVGALLSITLLVFLKRNDLFSEYGLRRSSVSDREMLYYIPVVVLISTNFGYNVNFKLSILEGVLYILTMLCVGFLEEIIFRGLLFNAMRKDTPKAAVIVSSLTFGIGHIINLFNGSGATLVPSLLQVIYATAAGFMFVMIYCKTQSLVVCILTHGLFNATSIFAAEPATISLHIRFCVILTLITGAYALYIALVMKKGKSIENKNTDM